MVRHLVDFGKKSPLLLGLLACMPQAKQRDPGTAPFVFREELSAFEKNLADSIPIGIDPVGNNPPLYVEKTMEDLIWVLGPEKHRVRRNKGPIEHLKSYLYAYRKNKPKDPILAYNLNSDHVIDAKDLLIDKKKLFIVGMGSSVLWSAVWNGIGLERITVQETGLGPRRLKLLNAKTLEVTEELEGAVSYWKLEDLSFEKRVYLGDKKENSLADLGKILYYTEGLWKLPPGEAYTCNTCHPDGGSDHRLHPGFHESRWEITRPIWGIRHIKPIFTNMSAKTLADAVEGLVRSLDYRFWVPEKGHEEYWLEPKTIRIQRGKFLELDARTVRKALLAYLYTLNFRRSNEPIDEQSLELGTKLLNRDCVSCHQMKTPLFAKTGIEPFYTENGNRVSPLVNLSRGGPFMSNGQFASLEDVLKAFGTESEHQHYKKGRRPYYSSQEIKALSQVLRSL